MSFPLSHGRVSIWAGVYVVTIMTWVLSLSLSLSLSLCEGGVGNKCCKAGTKQFQQTKLVHDMNAVTASPWKGAGYNSLVSGVYV